MLEGQILGELQTGGVADTPMTSYIQLHPMLSL